jgi:Cu+-exporting ATPase
MALEPEMVTADAGPNPELADMSRRLWIGLALTGPVFALEMGGTPARSASLDRPADLERAAACARDAVVLWAGWPFFERGWASIKTRNLNMFTLIAMGTGVAWVYSVVGTLLPGLFPRRCAAMTARSRSISRRRPSSPVLVLSARFSSWKRASRPSGAIRALLDLSPKMARRDQARRRGEDVSLDQVWSATVCACGRVSACRSTARSSRAAAPSTSPW